MRLGCGEGIRTPDLRVMSPTSCRCSTPRPPMVVVPPRSVKRVDACSARLRSADTRSRGHAHRCALFTKGGTCRQTLSAGHRPYLDRAGGHASVLFDEARACG